MHQVRIGALHKQRIPAVSAQQLLELLAWDPGEDGRVGNLVAVEVQDRQHGTVGHRTEKLVGVPGGGERSGFRFAITDHARNHQFRIVEYRSERVTQRIAKLTALVDGTRAFR